MTRTGIETYWTGTTTGGAKDRGNWPAARIATVAGLTAGAAGLGIMKAAGVAMPVVPPGAVLLLLAAALVSGLGARRWPSVVAVLAGLAEVAGIVASGSLTELGSGDALLVAGTVVRCAGVAVAVVAGAILWMRRGRALS